MKTPDAKTSNFESLVEILASNDYNMIYCDANGQGVETVLKQGEFSMTQGLPQVYAVYLLFIVSHTNNPDEGICTSHITPISHGT